MKLLALNFYANQKLCKFVNIPCKKKHLLSCIIQKGPKENDENFQKNMILKKFEKGNVAGGQSF